MSVRIGIDLGGTKISGVVLDAAGGELVRLRIPSPRDHYDATVAAIAELTARPEAEAGVAPGMVPLGVGTPGTWQPRLQCVKNCNSTWLNDRPLLFRVVRCLPPGESLAEMPGRCAVGGEQASGEETAGSC